MLRNRECRVHGTEADRLVEVVRKSQEKVKDHFIPYFLDCQYTFRSSSPKYTLVKREMEGRK